jgi:hypothetical protein
MLKLVGSIIGGIAAAFAIVFATDALFHSMAAGSAPANAADSEAMAAWVASQPAIALLTVLVGWAVAVFVGSTIAARFSGRGQWPAWTVTIVFLAATLANFLMVRHPAWMMPTAIVLILIAGWLGAKMASRTSAASVA